jgi:hypothetical protein
MGSPLTPFCNEKSVERHWIASEMKAGFWRGAQ